jgi:hypothetical protein
MGGCLVMPNRSEQPISGNQERAAKDASRAVREYLATLDDAAFGAASEVTPKFVSPSDPAAQWTGAMTDTVEKVIQNDAVELEFEIIESEQMDF